MTEAQIDLLMDREGRCFTYRCGFYDGHDGNAFNPELGSDEYIKGFEAGRAVVATPAPTGSETT